MIVRTEIRMSYAIPHEIQLANKHRNQLIEAGVPFRESITTGYITLTTTSNSWLDFNDNRPHKP